MLPRLIVFAILLSSCTRTPPEPTAASSTATAAQAVTPKTNAASAPTGAPSAKPTCIRELSATPAPSASAASASACPKDPAPQTFTTSKVELPEATGDLKAITVELAKSPDETSRGLMYRRSMPEDRGMLFDLRVRKVQAFWMRNTCIPLDMMFIEDDGTIVGILEQVPVLNEDERSVGCPSRYVLEVNAGFARRHGIKPGQKVKLP